jgi:hypothetical protein
MKRIILVTLLILAIVLIPANNVLAARPHSASGVARTDMENWAEPVIGTVRFHASQTDPITGAAKGQGYFNFADCEFHADVLFLGVDLSTNKAWLGLVVTQTNNLQYPVGQEMVWEIQDNGHSGDRWGLIFYDAEDALDHPDIFNNEINNCISGGFKVN